MTNTQKEDKLVLDILKKAETQEFVNQLNILAQMLTDDYKARSDNEYLVEFEFGNKYVKIIKTFCGQKSVAGFVVCSHNAKFPYGTLLKAQSWKAPATNFSRGSIFELEGKKFSWTGIQ